MEESGIITLTTFATLQEAEAARMRLEEEGIEAEVEGAVGAAGMPWAMSGMAIKLLVQKQDVEKAAEILSQKADAVQEGAEDFDGDGHLIRRCPRCGSGETEEIPRQALSVRRGVPVIGLLATAVLFYKRDWQCKGCGNRWKTR